MTLSRRKSFWRRQAFALVLGIAAGGAMAAAAAEAPVVLALDSSRSLSPAESRATTELAKELLAGLPGAAAPGVLVFDDEVRWLVRPGGSGGTSAVDALDSLTPAGRFTVLNDGLIEGVRALEDGGVLVLLSDGKDENSATTFEDAARLASANGVRLVTVAAGRADERTLRRLALLTGGLHAGRVGAIDTAALRQQIAGLRTRIAADRAARAPKVTPEPPAPSAAAVAAATAALAAQQPAPPAGLVATKWLLPVGGALAALGIVIGFLLARRRAAAAGESRELDGGTQPGVQWPEAAAAIPEPTATSLSTAPAFSAPPQAIDEVQIARARLRPAVRPQGLMEISLDETAAFQRLPFSESIERTLVLTAEVVLTVREPGREPRSYRLPPDRAVDIGRDATLNTLAFQDPTMSTQHLRVVLDNDEVYLVDLGSTNGVLVGERRVDAVQLHPGDRFRAGMIEFELGLHHASTGRVESA
ncbi:MAG: FHA domain-containing protein [Thermoanaerobaculia bacterium]